MTRRAIQVLIKRSAACCARHAVVAFLFGWPLHDMGMRVTTPVEEMALRRFWKVLGCLRARARCCRNIASSTAHVIGDKCATLRPNPSLHFGSYCKEDNCIKSVTQDEHHGSTRRRLRPCPGPAGFLFSVSTCMQSEALRACFGCGCTGKASN